MNIFLSPHNDDESLFGAFTLLRVKPLVVIVTDSFKQPWTNWITRRNETLKAAKILGVEVCFLGIPDKDLTEEILQEKLQYFLPERVFAPTGSHKDHDLVRKVAKELWGDKVNYYTTYEGTNYHIARGFEVVPTIEEIELKNKALDCYTSQLTKNAPHFDAVRGKSEYYDIA